MRKLLLISLLVSTTLLSFSNDSKAVKKEELKKFLTTKMNEFKKSDEFKEIKSSIADLKKELRKAKKNAPDKVEELNKKLENLRAELTKFSKDARKEFKEEFKNN